MTDSHSTARQIHPLLTSAFDTGFDAEHALQALLQAGAAGSAEAALLRVVLLRRDYPDAQITTELVQREGRGTTVRAAITLPTGASASGYADAGNESSTLEETERRAIGRALDILGHTVIVAQPTPTLEPRAPAQQAARPAVATTTSDTESTASHIDPEYDEEPNSSSTQSQPPESVAGQSQPPSVVDAMRRANLRRRPQGAAGTPLDEDIPQEDTFRAPPPVRQGGEPVPPPPPPVSTTVANEEKEPALEDYSWTAFWRVARPQGFNKVKVEERIGRSIDGMTPIQVREALAETGITL